jgi:hypothetical protein
MGSVTASENIRWLIPLWAWFVLVVLVELQKSSPQVLSITFFLMFIASAIPFCGYLDAGPWNHLSFAIRSLAHSQM